MAGSPTGHFNGLRKGIIFRSANPDTISRKDVNLLKSMGIKTIIDLRASFEIKKRNRHIDGIEIVSIPMDFERKTRESLYPLLSEKNPEEKILQVSNSLYLEILDASGPVIKQIADMLVYDRKGPILIHCQAGKDRTGIIIALIQMAMGADRRFIIESYMKSNEEILPYYRKVLLLRKILRFGFFPSDAILYAIEVKEKNIDSVLERVDYHYGGINHFLTRAGISDEQINLLRLLLTANHNSH